MAKTANAISPEAEAAARARMKEPGTFTVRDIQAVIRQFQYDSYVSYYAATLLLQKAKAAGEIAISKSHPRRWYCVTKHSGRVA